MKPSSTTARLAYATLGVVALFGAAIIVLALTAQVEVVEVVVPELSKVAGWLALSGMGGTGFYGARHFGAATPPSALWVTSPQQDDSSLTDAPSASNKVTERQKKGDRFWPRPDGRAVRLEDEP